MLCEQPIFKRWRNLKFTRTILHCSIVMQRKYAPISLLDLASIGEIAAADIIERICFKLQLNDRLAWNADKGSGIETIGLDQFGTWLCNRVATYQNASSIADDQLNGAPERKRDKQHYRSNKTSTETSDKNIYTSGSS